MQAVASLRYGVIFKKAFSQPDIFTAFVKDILGIELDIDRVETEKSFPSPVGSIDSRFDLFAEDKTQRIIVDIQHRRYSDHYHRFLHYHCAALLEQGVTAKNYQPALQVYTIVILTSGDRHQRDMSQIDFDPKDRHGQGLGEIPHKILFLCPKYVNAETPEPWREWLLAIDDSLDGQVDETHYHKACVQKILAIIRQDSLTPQERARMKDEYSEEAWLQDKLGETLQQGLVQGRQEEKEEVALRLLAKGMDVVLVAEVTGLSLEQLHLAAAFTQK